MRQGGLTRKNVRRGTARESLALCIRSPNSRIACDHSLLEGTHAPNSAARTSTPLRPRRTTHHQLPVPLSHSTIGTSTRAPRRLIMFSTVEDRRKTFPRWPETRRCRAASDSLDSLAPCGNDWIWSTTSGNGCWSGKRGITMAPLQPADNLLTTGPTHRPASSISPSWIPSWHTCTCTKWHRRKCGGDSMTSPANTTLASTA